MLQGFTVDLTGLGDAFRVLQKHHGLHLDLSVRRDLSGALAGLGGAPRAPPETLAPAPGLTTAEPSRRPRRP